MSRKVRSFVWNYFQKNESNIAECTMCKKKLSIKSGNTSNMMCHIRNHHTKIYNETIANRNMPKHESLCENADDPVLTKDTVTEGEPSTSGMSSSEVSNMSSSTIPNRQLLQTSLDSYKILSKKVTKKLDDAVANFIVTDMMPYDIVERDGFRRMIKTFLPNYTLPSRKAFTDTKIPQLQRDTETKIFSLLLKADYIAITTDCWTSNTMQPFIAVTAHFVNIETWEFQSLCLSCCRMNDNHTAENLKEVLLDILDKWRINVNKITGCTTDNGSNILKCVHLLSWTHVSCFGHTLNIGINRVYKNDNFHRCIKKAKSIQTSIAHSWQLKRDLSAIQIRLNIPQHSIPSVCETRWWSVLRLLKTIIEQHVALVTLFSESHKKKYNSIALTADELQILKILVMVTEPLESICQHMCGEKYITLSAIWPILCKLRDTIGLIEELDTDPDDDFDTISSLANEIKLTIIGALDERYKREEVQILLQKATFLDPRMRLEYLKGYEEAIKNEIQQEAQNIMIEDKVNYPANKQYQEKKKLTGLQAILQPKLNTTNEITPVGGAIAVKNEIEAYIKQLSIDLDTDPLAWWKSHERDFPRLAKLAKKYLCIPGTSVPSERVFSCAGKIISDTRTCLTADHAHQLIFLAMNKNII